MTIETIQEKINKINTQLSKINNIRNQEKISNFLDKEVYPTFKETFNNINFSGWRYDIETDLKEIWLTGALSQGSQSMSSWKGETFRLANIKMVEEPDNWFNIDDIDITQEEKERIASYLNIEIDELNDWIYACEVESTFSELYTEKYQKLFDEYIYNEWCYYKKDALTDDIYNNLDIIENSLENELEELEDELHFIEQKQA